jgi:ribonuclease P protein component
MLERLKKRREFLSVAAADAKFVTRSFVLQYRVSEECRARGCCRVGFTVTKRQGGAVVRNRIRRRLREALRHAYARNPLAGWELVVIGRHTAHSCPFSVIEQDFRYALSRLEKQA